MVGPNERARCEQRRREALVHGDVAERGAERARFPQRRPARRVAHPRVVRGEDDHERRDREASEDASGGKARVNVSSVRRDGAPGGRRRRAGRHPREQLTHGPLQLGAASRVEAPADGGRAHRTRAYLRLWPIVRPKEISPLSMRMLNPQSGFVHTQAL